MKEIWLGSYARMIITKAFEFDACHRLLGHPGKCANLHGHRYKVTVDLSGPINQIHGTVVDFAEMKYSIGQVIDDRWDHATLVNGSDSALLLFLQQERMRHFVFPPDLNPTAENLAIAVFGLAERVCRLWTLRNDICDPLIANVTTEFVEVWETPTCAARYTRDDWLGQGHHSTGESSLFQVLPLVNREHVVKKENG